MILNVKKRDMKKGEETSDAEQKFFKCENDKETK